MKQINAIHYSVIPNSNNNAGDNYLYLLIRLLLEKFLLDKGCKVNWEIHSQWEVSSAYDSNNGSADFALFGGGGLFLPDQKGAQTSNNTGWQINIPKSEYPRFSIPYFGAAIGFNWFRFSDFDKKIIRDSAIAFLENACEVGIRNKGSIKDLEEITGVKNKMFWLPCPTTLLKKLIQSDINVNIKQNLRSQILEKRFCSNNKNLKIGINLSCDRLKQRGINDETLSSLRAALEILKEQGHSIIYLAHKDLDLYAYKKLGSSLFNDLINISTYGPNEIVESYLNFDIVLGGRGHSLMIPFGIGIPIISLTTHNKQKYFMEDCKLSNFSIEITELPKEIITLKLIESINAISDQEKCNQTYQLLGLNAWREFSDKINKKVL